MAKLVPPLQPQAMLYPRRFHVVLLLVRIVNYRAEVLHLQIMPQTRERYPGPQKRHEGRPLAWRWRA